MKLERYIPLGEIADAHHCSAETVKRRARRAGVVLVNLNPGGAVNKWAIAERDVGRLTAAEAPTAPVAPFESTYRPTSRAELRARLRA